MTFLFLLLPSFFANSAVFITIKKKHYDIIQDDSTFVLVEPKCLKLYKAISPMCLQDDDFLHVFFISIILDMLS